MSGKTICHGGILPDDNVRVYVPLDINEAYIIGELCSIYDRLGDVSEHNEYEYCLEVRRIITKLEIYDQIHTGRNMKNAVSPAEAGGVNGGHSQQGIAVARKIVKILESYEGTAESFPYEIVAELNAAFGI